MINFINTQTAKRPHIRPQAVSMRDLKKTFGDCEKELRRLVRSGQLFYYEGVNDIYFYTEQCKIY